MAENVSIINRIGESLSGIGTRLRKFRKNEPTTLTPATVKRRNHTRDDPFSLREKMERKQRVKVILDMEENDSRLSAILSQIALDTLKGNFSIEVDNGPDPDRAKQSAADMCKRLDLKSNMEQWLRETLLEGDSFLELGINRRRQLVKVLRLSNFDPDMVRNSDFNDEFPEPNKAYYQTNTPSSFLFNDSGAPRDAVYFPDWKIIHARWDKKSRNRYGRSIFWGSIRAYRRLDDGEVSVATGRKHSGSRILVHKLATMEEHEIEAYRNANEQALGSSYAMAGDIYTDQEKAVDVIDGDAANLERIGDIRFHLDTFAASTPLPIIFLGYYVNVNRDILDDALSKYEESLITYQQWCVNQIIKPLVETQWNLDGMPPEQIEWRVVWGNGKTITAKMVNEAGVALNQMKMWGLPLENQVELLSQMLPIFTPGEVLGAMKKMEKEAEAKEALLAKQGQQTNTPTALPRAAAAKPVKAQSGDVLKEVDEILSSQVEFDPWFDFNGNGRH